MELAQQIRRYRTEKGLSQEDLAAAIYVSRQTISNWENDKTYPDVQSLLLLSNVFEVSIDSLIKGDVETMTKIINEDGKHMMRKAWAGLFLAALSVVVFAVGIFAFELGMLLSLVLFAIVYVPAIVLLRQVESMKRDHDLVTYAEIKAFCEGEEVVRETSRGIMMRKHQLAVGIVLSILAAVLGGAVSYGLCVLLDL